MGHRMEQVNDLLRQELSVLLSREWDVPDCMVTITHVKCSPNLLEATIFISILPEKKSLSTIKSLKKLNSQFSNTLKNKLNLKRIPRFTWRINTQERKAAEIDKIFNEINREG